MKNIYGEASNRNTKMYKTVSVLKDLIDGVSEWGRGKGRKRESKREREGEGRGRQGEREGARGREEEREERERNDKADRLKKKDLNTMPLTLNTYFL